LEEDILVDFILIELIRFPDGPLRWSQGPASELWRNWENVFIF